MHFGLLWIFWLLSPALAVIQYGPDEWDGLTEEQTQTLKESQVVETVTAKTRILAIYLGHIKDKPQLLKVLHILRTKASKPQYYMIDLRSFFIKVSMHDRYGILRRLRGVVDLRVQYVLPKEIRKPNDVLLLDNWKGDMRRLKAAASVVLVKEAYIHDTLRVKHNTQATVESLKKGQVVWVSSKIMYGEYEAKQQFHFAIFLDFAEPKDGSHRLKIAQIVMDLPISIPHYDLVDFDFYFPTTWWSQEPQILLDGDIDLVIHKIDPQDIRIPNTILILDLVGVGKLERHMVALTRYPSVAPGRSSSVPPTFRILQQNDINTKQGGLQKQY